MNKWLYKFVTIIFLCLLAINYANCNSYEEDCEECSNIPDFYKENKIKNITQNINSIKILPNKKFKEIVILFSNTKCSYCEKLAKHLIPEIAKKTGKKIETRVLYINKKENYEKLFYLLKGTDFKHKELPVLVGASSTLFGTKEINENLNIFLANNNSHVMLPDVKKSGIKQEIQNTFKSFSPFIVIGAGLIDGINPCAFSTIIFLISYLSFYGLKRKSILYCGLFFTLGVFVLYFAVGIGLYEVLAKIISYRLHFLIYIKYFFSAIVFIFFALSLYDVINLTLKNQTKKMILQLPESYKKKMHGYIRAATKTRWTIFFSFFLGIIISSIELACTGQVYFPTITYLINDINYRVEAIYYLLLYNLAFILPLVAVFLLIFLGLSVKKLEKFTRQHLIFNKILLTVLFLLLFIVLAT